MKPTPSQLTLLKLAHRDGSIITSGIDKTPNINSLTLSNCIKRGWLKDKTGRFDLGGYHGEWVLSDAGRQVLLIEGEAK